MNIVYTILLVVTFDAYLFLNQQKKYRGYLNANLSKSFNV